MSKSHSNGLGFWGRKWTCIPVPKKWDRTLDVGTIFGQSKARCLGIVLDSPKLKLLTAVGQSRTTFGTVFGQSGIEVLGLF